MKVDLFDFDLPERLIAQAPVEPRDAARLLHVPVNGSFADYGVRDLLNLLGPGDLMALNDTKVIPTRLFGQRDAVAVEATLIEEVATDCWQALARPGKRLRVGDRVVFADDLTALVEDKLEDGRIVFRFEVGGASLRDALWRIGSMPLPPYIKRARGGDSADNARYQTVFAEKEGAVAAPTASLHFTDELLSELSAKGVQMVRLTLHVGAGTFQPIKVEDTADHIMHSETAFLSKEAATKINAHRQAGGRVLACGTTAMRTLESAARTDHTVEAFDGPTDLFITPGYRFRAVDRLMTNFHLPKSTLFMLVSAFCGLDRMQGAYAHAIAQNYRFFSFGDASLLEKADG